MLSNLFDKVQVLLSLVGLHTLTQSHHGPHNVRSRVVYTVVCPVQHGRGGRLHFLKVICIVEQFINPDTTAFSNKCPACLQF